MACCKTCFKVFVIILCFLDIGVGWFKFYQIYEETNHLVEELKTTTNSELKQDCPNPQLYWKIYVGFEALGTILCVIEIYFLILEIKEDKSLFNACFSRAWFLIVAIYLFAVFPSSIVDIIYRDNCICYEGFSFHEWSSDVRDFFRGFLGGASVICLQILFHLTDLYTKFRRFCDVCCLCKDAKEEDDAEPKPKSKHCCTKGRLCFSISFVLLFIFIALFITEIVFIFCIKYN